MIVRHVEPGRIAAVQKWGGREINYVGSTGRPWG